MITHLFLNLGFSNPKEKLNFLTSKGKKISEKRQQEEHTKEIDKTLRELKKKYSFDCECDISWWFICWN